MRKFYLGHCTKVLSDEEELDIKTNLIYTSLIFIDLLAYKQFIGKINKEKIRVLYTKINNSDHFSSDKPHIDNLDHFSAEKPSGSKLSSHSSQKNNETNSNVLESVNDTSVYTEILEKKIQLTPSQEYVDELKSKFNHQEIFKPSNNIIYEENKSENISENFGENPIKKIKLPKVFG